MLSPAGATSPLHHCLLTSPHGLQAEYILVLDSDMIPHPDMLERTLGHFYERRTDSSGKPGSDGQPGGSRWVPKRNVAFLQTPQVKRGRA